MVFTDYGLASGFAHWTRTNPGAKLQGLEFNYTDGNSLVPVKKTGAECDKDYDPMRSRLVDKANLNSR